MVTFEDPTGPAGVRAWGSLALFPRHVASKAQAVKRLADGLLLRKATGCRFYVCPSVLSVSSAALNSYISN
jgi:hypothetical protein